MEVTREEFRKALNNFSDRLNFEKDSIGEAGFYIYFDGRKVFNYSTPDSYKTQDSYKYKVYAEVKKWVGDYLQR